MKRRAHSGPILLLALLLVLSAGLNLLLLLTDRTQPQWADHPVGAYSTVNASSPSAADGLYLTLEASGTYCVYRQGEILDTGRYAASSPADCYALYSSDSLHPDTQLIWTGASVYWLTPDDLLLFWKFSDTPTYIGTP